MILWNPSFFCVSSFFAQIGIAAAFILGGGGGAPFFLKIKKKTHDK
ncbi:MAG: hypothetical protein RL757_1410 [Bacteroidota bacterium]